MSNQNWADGVLLNSQKKKLGFGSSVTHKSTIDMRLRVRAMWAVLVICIAVVCAKLIYLQVIEQGMHELASGANNVEIVRDVAMRGKIQDRNGETLEKNIANSSVVGYVSKVVKDEIGCNDGICYSGESSIGRAGVEREFESILRGRDGGKLIEVNASGKEVRELGRNQSEPGQDLSLSIDSRLQNIAYNALSNKHGSVVILDMQGKVISLISSPSYDPQDLTKYLSDSKEQYFFNRAISGVYPPGSVFKPVTAYAGLSDGKITSTTKILDTGEIKVGSYRYGNWYFDQYGRTEGEIDLAKALARSNDVYFYKVGEMVGVSSLVKWARKFGLGEKTGIELPGEANGLVPDELWKERQTGEKWFLGNTYHLAIGQGDLLTSPVQVARMMLAEVTGRVCDISILKNSEIKCRDLGLKTQDIESVKTGMRAACAPGGTAFPFFTFEPWVLCKTGTAQQGSQKTDKSHAWITIAYPGENPQMIIVVMLEAGGEGSADAAPIAKTILEEWKKL